MAIRLLVVAFFVFYVGSESGYGGWISSYVLRRGVVDDKTQAVFVTSVYWGGLTAGRLLAIPIAITLTTSTYLQAQLAQAVVGVVLPHDHIPRSAAHFRAKMSKAKRNKNETDIQPLFQKKRILISLLHTPGGRVEGKSAAQGTGAFPKLHSLHHYVYEEGL